MARVVKDKMDLYVKWAAKSGCRVLGQDNTSSNSLNVLKVECGCGAIISVRHSNDRECPVCENCRVAKKRKEKQQASTEKKQKKRKGRKGRIDDAAAAAREGIIQIMIGVAKKSKLEYLGQGKIPSEGLFLCRCGRNFKANILDVKNGKTIRCKPKCRPLRKE